MQVNFILVLNSDYEWHFIYGPGNTLCVQWIFAVCTLSKDQWIFLLFKSRGRYSTHLSELQHFDKVTFLKSSSEYFLGGNNSMFKNVLDGKG